MSGLSRTPPAHNRVRGTAELGCKAARSMSRAGTSVRALLAGKLPDRVLGAEASEVPRRGHLSWGSKVSNRMVATPGEHEGVPCIRGQERFLGFRAPACLLLPTLKTFSGQHRPHVSPSSGPPMLTAGSFQLEEHPVQNPLFVDKETEAQRGADLLKLTQLVCSTAEQELTCPDAQTSNGLPTTVGTVFSSAHHFVIISALGQNNVLQPSSPTHTPVTNTKCHNRRERRVVGGWAAWFPP